MILVKVKENHTGCHQSGEGGRGCNILFAKESHKVYVKCHSLNLEYGSATKTYVEAPSSDSGSNLWDQLGPQ